ncbi:MAG: hypothetical protein RXN92_01190 [Thermoplasmatales archaeon]
MGKGGEVRIIKSRMNELFQLALIDDKMGLTEYSHIKYELIFKYSTKYRVRRPEGFKVWVCRKCKYSIIPNGGSIRIRRSALIVKCGKCGYIRRYKINHSSMVSALNSTL